MERFAHSSAFMPRSISVRPRSRSKALGVAALEKVAAFALAQAAADGREVVGIALAVDVEAHVAAGCQFQEWQ